MQNIRGLFIGFTFFVLTGQIEAATPQDIVKPSEPQGGLLVHLAGGDSDTDPQFITGLQTQTGPQFVVHGLYRDRAQIDKARTHIKQNQTYGPNSIQHWPAGKKHLPYADNIVNILIASAPGEIADSEIVRVLAPRGMALIGSGKSFRKIVKPLPDDIDEWTHYLHGPDNNAVARDSRVGLPKHVQWIGFPKFARSHEQLASVSAMVTSGGRVFYLIDEGVRADIRMPPRWKLVARDAFNGVVLWKRTIEKWSDHMRGFRSGPADLAFRLVADGDRLYATLGIDQPVTALDAATGKTLLTYKGSARTRQIMHSGETLVMLLGGTQETIHLKLRGKAKSASRIIQASNRKTGEVMWRKEVSIETLAPLVVSGDWLLYQTDANLVCLELKSGKEKWSVSHPCKLVRNGGAGWKWAAPTLTACNGIVYIADFKTLTAFSVADGKSLWNSSATAGFCSPPDIFVIDGLLWRGYTRSRGSADFGQGLDAKTGELKKTINTKKAWDFATLAHHRCYRPKATSRFIMSSRSGVEFIDIKSGKISPNHWVRGTCQYGVMPANGLLYAPPHSCACNIKTMLKGLFALAPSRDEPKIDKTTDVRLETGEAFGKIPAQTAEAPWPTFRHDNQRSGRCETTLPKALKQTWRTKIGGRISSPVMACGKIFVAEIDAHTIHALDANAGKTAWTFTASGRIDSPPTIHNNTVIFGSADGWVYCLRQSDGVLAWRFRAAPTDRLIPVRGQIESAWPVHGSTLIHEGKLIVAAGRSSYLDGGIYVYRLDAATGKKLSETVINSTDPKTGHQRDGGVDLRGVLNDVLSASGGSIYMRHLKIDFETGGDLKTGPPHLFAPTGYLDDTWWHRSYWIFGSDAVCMPPVNESGWQIWPRVGNMLPSGRILAMNAETVFGYGRDKYPGGMSGQIRGGETYRIFAAEKKMSHPLPSYRKDQHLRGARSGNALKLKTTKRDRQHGAPSLHKYLWTKPMPIFVRALVLTDKTLAVAGPPEPSEARTSNMKLKAPEKIESAFGGEQGAVIRLVSTADGKTLSEYKLDSSPIFDGMIAADKKIYIALQDGSIACFGK
ncbi:MAG: PQQ-binding-like beta-propeller repeat protein [Phycisphaerales bacterium]|nr:PQQ-binding-like beta-propeller repeat protein [Phycisphaerales bacterium]